MFWLQLRMELYCQFSFWTAEARLLGQTRKPNTDWKPNYGLLTRSAWMFCGNPWDTGRNDGPMCFIAPNSMTSLSWMWWLPQSLLSKCGYSTFHKMMSWQPSMHRSLVLDVRMCVSFCANRVQSVDILQEETRFYWMLLVRRKHHPLILRQPWVQDMGIIQYKSIISLYIFTISL